VPAKKSVFSNVRDLTAPGMTLPEGMDYNTRMKMDGLDFLSRLKADSVPVAFLDPQYRGILEKMRYGNEGVGRSRARCDLRQMPEDEIQRFILRISKCLIPNGHLFLWVDKFHLCNGCSVWWKETDLDAVDMLTWDKDRMGMGYRTRRSSEHLMVLQKQPRRAKGVWQIHDILDVWTQKAERGGGHPHRKPVKLQAKLIRAVSNPGDVVIDPAAGSFSVLDECLMARRKFLGCDLI